MDVFIQKTGLIGNWSCFETIAGLIHLPERTLWVLYHLMPSPKQLKQSHCIIGPTEKHEVFAWKKLSKLKFYGWPPPPPKKKPANLSNMFPPTMPTLLSAKYPQKFPRKKFKIEKLQNFLPTNISCFTVISSVCMRLSVYLSVCPSPDLGLILYNRKAY